MERVRVLWLSDKLSSLLIACYYVCLKASYLFALHDLLELPQRTAKAYEISWIFCFKRDHQLGSWVWGYFFKRTLCRLTKKGEKQSHKWWWSHPITTHGSWLVRHFNRVQNRTILISEDSEWLQQKMLKLNQEAYFFFQFQNFNVLYLHAKPDGPLNKHYNKMIDNYLGRSPGGTDIFTELIDWWQNWLIADLIDWLVDFHFHAIW